MLIVNVIKLNFYLTRNSGEKEQGDTRRKKSDKIIMWDSLQGNGPVSSKDQCHKKKKNGEQKQNELKEPCVPNLDCFPVRKKSYLGDDWENLDWKRSVFLGVVTRWLCRTRALFLRITCSVVFSVEVKCLDVYNFQIAQKNTHVQNKYGKMLASVEIHMVSIGSSLYH